MAKHEMKAGIITGASKGIGAAAARALAGDGMAVVIAARTTENLEALRQEIVAVGGRAEIIACDVARHADVEATVALCQDAFGRVDLLVNNAGLIDPIARLGDSNTNDWARVVDVNLMGVYHGMRAVIPIMEAQRAGVIINISSGAATGALEGWSHYCATKAAVLSLTRCGHKEYYDKGVRVVGLSPGTVATDMQAAIKASGINPVSKLDPSVHIPPEWVGRAISWLATDEGKPFDGGDFSLKTDEGRRLVGLPEIA